VRQRVAQGGLATFSELARGRTIRHNSLELP